MGFDNKPIKNSNRKNFIIFPIVFFIVGYFIIFLAFIPIISPYAKLANMLFLDVAPTFDEKAANIYAQESTQPSSQISSSGNAKKLSEITFPSFGDMFAHISIPGTSVDADMYYGDSNTELKNGVGVYIGGFIPGYGKTTLIAGHNNTFFRGLGNAEIGGTITISTNYGNYTYEITETKVASAKNSKAYDLSKDEENIILYTCYPFDCLGLTPQRYFVYAKYLSGPLLDTNH